MQSTPVLTIPMTKRKIIQLNRKWHRYLGLILGIQFLLWTLGGLYFSWTNIEEIRGDHLKKQSVLPNTFQNLVSPSSFLDQHARLNSKLVSMELIGVLGKPVYRVLFETDKGKHVELYDALNGELRAPLTEKEAVLTAMEGLALAAGVTEVERLTKTGKHHEYRGRPLPAYAITFAEPANTTIYVSEEFGDIQTFRSNQWRIFDFLWMLHTMDYAGRDDFNNLLLRAFALFGLFTLFSGFSLFWLTSKNLASKKKSKVEKKKELDHP